MEQDDFDTTIYNIGDGIALSIKKQLGSVIMKIAIVTDVLGEENNGTVVACMNLIRYLESRGHELHIVCPDETKEGVKGYYILKQTA